MNIASNSNHFPSVSSAFWIPNRQAGRADRSKFNDEPWGDHGGVMGRHGTFTPKQWYLRFHPSGQRNGEIQISFKYIFFPPEKIIFWQKKTTAKEDRFFFTKKWFYIKKNTHSNFPRNNKFHQETGIDFKAVHKDCFIHESSQHLNYPLQAAQWKEPAKSLEVWDQKNIMTFENER